MQKLGRFADRHHGAELGSGRGGAVSALFVSCRFQFIFLPLRYGRGPLSIAASETNRRQAAPSFDRDIMG